MISDKTPTCLVRVKYRSNIDTTENTYVVIISLYVIRTIDIPSFQYLFGSFFSLKNNCTINRAKFLEREVPLMLSTSVGMEISG